VDLLAEAALVGLEGARAALATVLRTAGSTPRHAAAKMVVVDGAVRAGTIGGGRLEHDVTALAAKVAAGAPAQRLERHLAAELGMCCGGRVEVFVEPLDRARAVPLAEAARRRARRLPCALVTALDGSGKDVRDDDPCLAARRPRLEAKRFVEPVLPPERLVIYGAGHIARALAPLAARVGFEVVVCDEDEAFLSEDRFPGVHRIASFSPVEVEAELAPFGPGDHVLIVTRDHAVDQAILEAYLGREALLGRADLASLGLVGSRAKLARFRQRLTAKGMGDEAAWARLRSPVGLDLGAETPDEIALSIVAELVAKRAGKS
jgi:xanthine dehydrogenase accessory factor